MSKFLGFFIGIAFVTLLLMAAAGQGILLSQQSDSCAAAGGHYVRQSFTASECWLDGKRIFPKGF